MNKTKGRMFRRMMAVMLSAAMISGSTLGAVQAAELDGTAVEAVTEVTEPVVEEAAELDAVEADGTVEAEDEDDVTVTAEPEADAEEDEEVMLDVSEETDAPELVLEDASLQALEEGEGEETGGTPEETGYTFDAESGALVIQTAGGLAAWVEKTTTADDKSQVHTIVIQEGVTEIPDKAFKSYTALTSAVMPDGLTKIGVEAFDGCTSLSVAAIPSTVTALGARSFRQTVITSVEIPEGITSIGSETFKGCKQLKTVTLHKGLTTLSACFVDCTSLDQITLPEGLTTIRGTFEGCTNLGKTDKTIKIPDSVKTVADKAFKNCTSLVRMEIPDGVSAIPGVFCGCSSLEDVVLSKNLTTLSSYKEIISGLKSGVFQGCISLKTLTFKGNKPPKILDDTCFENVPLKKSLTESSTGKLIIYYPAGYLDIYRNHWQKVENCPSSIKTGIGAAAGFVNLNKEPEYINARAKINLNVAGYTGEDAELLGKVTLKRFNYYDNDYKDVEIECPLTSTVADGVITYYSTEKNLNTASYYKWAINDVELSEEYFQLAASKETTLDYNYYTVFFKDGETVVDTKYVKEGGKVEKPEDAVKEGAIFDGWVSEDGETAFDFDAAINAATTICAKWHEHTLGDWEKDDSNHWQFCEDERCSGVKVNEAAHSYGEWKVTKEATADAAGLKEKVCECGHKVEETIPALHTHSYGTWKSDAKNHWKECSCGDKKETAAHSYGEWKVTKEATADAAGLKEKVCECGHKVEEAIPQVHIHSFGEWTTTKEATVQAAGTKTRSCKVCGAKETAETAKLAPFIELNVKNGETVPMKVKQKTSVLKVTGMAAGDSVKEWTSSNKKIVTVDAKTGKLTAKKKGTATVTVTLASGVSASVKIKVQKGTVKTKSVNVTVNGTKTKKLNLKKKEKATLTTLLKPLTTQQKLTYKSSNKKVAAVSKKGVVTAKKKGKAKITVKSGSKKFVITVYVK